MTDLNFIIDFRNGINEKRRQELCDRLKEESPSVKFHDDIFDRYPRYKQVLLEGTMPREDFERLFQVKTGEVPQEKDSPIKGGPYYFPLGRTVFPFPGYEDTEPFCRLKTVISKIKL